MRLFGSAKPKPKPQQANPDDVVKMLSDQLEILKKKQKFLEAKSQNELKLIRELATRDRRAALISLKRKKMWDQQVERLDGTMMTIETQINAIETASLNVQTFKTYKMGTDALKQIHGQIDVDRVDDAVDDLREQMDIAEEISQAISQPIGGAILDDAELEAELDELAQLSLDEQFLDMRQEASSSAAARNASTSQPVSFPAAPTHPVASTALYEDEDDAEFERLAAKLA